MVNGIAKAVISNNHKVNPVLALVEKHLTIMGWNVLARHHIEDSVSDLMMDGGDEEQHEAAEAFLQTLYTGMLYFGSSMEGDKSLEEKAELIKQFSKEWRGLIEA